MLRFLLAPRRLGLHLVALTLVGAFGWLGAWQLERATEAAGSAATRDPAPVRLERLGVVGQSLPGQAYGRRVTATGRYDAAAQVLVVDRPRGGVRGFWVLTPLRLADGSAAPVVRGWVRTPDAPAVRAVPSGEVTVSGRVYPSEQPGGGSRLPPGRTDAAGADPLARRAGYPVRDGFLVATAQRPPPDVAAAPVPARPWPSKAGGFPLQNAAYAVQWWLFGLFVVVMWVKVLREARRGRRAPHPPPADGPGRRPSRAASAGRR